MKIVNLISRVMDRALTRDFKFFCGECKKEIKFSGEGYYENDDGENSGTGYFPEGNVYIDLDGGEILTAVQCNECYEESQDPHSYLPIKKEGE